MSSKKTFIIGPGFIGWVVLDHLVKDGYEVTTLLRRKEHGAAIEKYGAKVVYGDLSDHDLIVKEVEGSDIVFHIATADDMPSVKAVLDGLKARKEKGLSTIYIHTSGTSVLNDDAAGHHTTSTIYADNDRALIDSLPASAPHRSIDLAILAAQKELGDNAKIAIMMPPKIYGYNAWNDRLSIQVPYLTRWAIKHGYAGHVGEGKSVWSQVHVNDLGRGYVILLRHMETSSAHEFLDNPYFFAENGKEHTWEEAAREIGKGLHAAGKIGSATPKTIPEGLYGDLAGPATAQVFGCNSRSRAVRLRKLGWQTKEKGIWESFHEDELPGILKE